MPAQNRLEGDAALIVSDVRARSFRANQEKATVTGAQLLEGSSYNYGFVVNGEVTEAEGGADIQYGRFLDELGWEFAAEEGGGLTSSGRSVPYKDLVQPQAHKHREGTIPDTSGRDQQEPEPAQNPSY